jgi:hypothetical protein
MQLVFLEAVFHMGTVQKQLLEKTVFSVRQKGVPPLLLLAACLRNTIRIWFGKAGAHPQLALEIAIAPETLSLIATFHF